jgi:hypothetical protein
MSNFVSISKTLSIRECGFDEAWLQDQIFCNPFVIGLGRLETVSKQQVNDGKFDVLLKDSEDRMMYAVGIMIGEMDESHIIRTIEYWDYERKRWPHRRHYAVLVAESINRRHSNVIQLLGLAIPLIVIQANMIDADGKWILHFTKTLDTYEKGACAPVESFDEAWWRLQPWSVEVFEKLVTPVMEKLELSFSKNASNERVTCSASLEKTPLRPLRTL